MAGEYFKDDVGWPVILFVVGLMSMGISVFIEKIKRKHITTVDSRFRGKDSSTQEEGG